LQVHPTRLCNLECLHCYSLSGPTQREELPPELLEQAISDAAAEGYNDVSFSGGEPVLYKPLRRLIKRTKSEGMLATVTSNGMLLDERRLQELAEVDLLAISLDGLPESHNKMRNSPIAFEKLAKNLEGVRQSGIPFGFIFTLTLQNLHELDWVAQFAIEQGAGLLQIHPLEEVGRASQVLQGHRPDGREAAFGYLEAVRLQAAAGDRLAIQIDFADRDLLRPDPGRVHAGECVLSEPDRLLSDLVNPLVIEQDGEIVPIQYGFGRRYSVGNLYNGRLADHGAVWRKETLPAFRGLCRGVFEAVVDSEDLPIFNWYEAVCEASRQPEPTLA
jgi:Fe-coproporphyrin III synthase